MVIEESSVVAAASSAAKFWAERGGFHTKVVSTSKVGQVHFIWDGDFTKLKAAFPDMKQEMLAGVSEITYNMQKRGGGIIDIELIDLRHEIENYYQLRATFETKDSMGANFINSCLEEFAQILKGYFANEDIFIGREKECDVIMSILSNYTPECIVKAHVACEIKALADPGFGMNPDKFAWRFQKAVEIAQKDVYRATTHNKGIFNGIDALILATGNDFRAVEAGGHTYAARDGQYRSLTSISVEDNIFRYELEIPMAVGTVGGLTSLHPLAKMSLELLGNPTASDLMQIAASAGLANNFSAVRSLVTKGIQAGHMKMHLYNILNYYKASQIEKEQAVSYFKDKKVSFKSVASFIEDIRTHDHLSDIKS
jgi:hydroxymethylglutaryl-CoA reductase